MKSLLAIVCLFSAGCALVPEYDTPISEENVERKEEILKGQGGAAVYESGRMSGTNDIPARPSRYRSMGGDADR